MIPAPANDRLPVQFWTAADVAKRVFGRTLRWFYGARRRLERDAGFPKPSVDNLYDPRVIDAWQRSLVPVDDKPPPVDADRLLRERGGKIAGRVPGPGR